MVGLSVAFIVIVTLFFLLIINLGVKRWREQEAAREMAAEAPS